MKKNDNSNQDTYSAPIVINLLEGYRVEDDAGHDLCQDGSVLQEVVVVSGWLLVNDRNNPLQNFMFKLNVSLKNIYC